MDPNASPSCGYSGTIKSYTDVVLTDSLAPLLGVYIGGPTYVVDGGSGTWDIGYYTPGTSPYTYAWSGILSGADSTVSGSPSASGYLYLRVIDSAADTAYSSYYVSVCAAGQLTC